MMRPWPFDPCRLTITNAALPTGCDAWTVPAHAYAKFGGSEATHPGDGGSSRVLSLSRELAVFLPEHHEDEYAYPLLVWVPLQPDLAALMHHLSARNYLAMTIRSVGMTESAWDRRSAATADWSRIQETVQRALEACTQRFRIHPRRIYLASAGRGGATALNLFLQHPDRFAGAVVLDNLDQHARTPLVRFRELRGKRVLMAARRSRMRKEVPGTLRVARLLHAAGVAVSAPVYTSRRGTSVRMLTDANRWLMQGIATTVDAHGS